MEVGRRRSGVKNSVVAGSVWESRMKSDEVKGGFKVYNGEESSKLEENHNNNKKKNSTNNGDSRRIVKRGQSGNLVGASGKRKTWKSESFDGPILQITAAGKDLSVSVDGGITKSPGLNKKGRSEEGNERSPIQIRKTRSEIVKASSVVDSCSNKEMVVVHSGEGVEKNNQSVLRKSKSESVKSVDQKGNGIEKKNSPPEAAVQLRKVKSESNKDLGKGNDDDDDEYNEGNEKLPVENEVIGSEENCKEFDVCEEKVIPTDVTEPREVLLPNTEDTVADEEFDEEEEDEDEDEEEEEEEVEEVEEVEKKEIKINVTEQKMKQSPEKIVVNEVKKCNQFHDKSPPVASTINKQSPPVVKRATIYSNFSNPTTSK